MVEYAGPPETVLFCIGGPHAITACMMHVMSPTSHSRAPRFRRRRAPHREVTPQAPLQQRAISCYGTGSREFIVAALGWQLMSGKIESREMRSHMYLEYALEEEEEELYQAKARLTTLSPLPGAFRPVPNTAAHSEIPATASSAGEPPRDWQRPKTASERGVTRPRPTAPRAPHRTPPPSRPGQRAWTGALLAELLNLWLHGFRAARAHCKRFRDADTTSDASPTWAHTAYLHFTTLGSAVIDIVVHSRQTRGRHQEQERGAAMILSHHFVWPISFQDLAFYFKHNIDDFFDSYVV